jgi:hypothetical protein
MRFLHAKDFEGEINSKQHATVFKIAKDCLITKLADPRISASG